MEKQEVIFKDLGVMEYQAAWEYQEKLLHENVKRKSVVYSRESVVVDDPTPVSELPTQHYLLFVEHPPVYTLGKSGNKENILLDDDGLKEKEIQFFNTNRGGDITFHGPDQLVGYPILDLEKFYTDIGRYLRNLEEVVILTMAEYGIKGDRSAGETGVWIEPGVPGRERKICAIGVHAGPTPRPGVDTARPNPSKPSARRTHESSRRVRSCPGRSSGPLGRRQVRPKAS